MKNKDIILKYSLQNAIFYKGKANPGAVLGKILSQDPSLRGNILDLKKEIETTVKQINSLSFEQQKKELEKLAPELMVKEKKEQEELPPLLNAEEGKVVTRFAPSPTGPLNLGQFLRATVISYAYAKKYNGKFILRIEDTDAKLIEKDFYEWMKEDLERIGIKYDQVVLQSDRMEIYYKYAEEMIGKGKAYVCLCSGDHFRQCKIDQKECECRSKTIDNNMGLWKEMLEGKYSDGDAVLRLKTDMCCPNPAIRDPPLLRVSKATHPIKGDKYSVWPLYNFSCMIDDHLLGVTHVFRGKEHEHNTAIQKEICDFFGWTFPTVVNFGMIRYPEDKIHTRDIKEWIKEGKVSGWDDPKLPTVRALLRRGFRPEALQAYGIELSLTKTDVTLDWGKMETINRRIIDSEANRYMVVVDPVKLTIDNAPEKHEIFEPVHPEFPEKGKKKVLVDIKWIFISSEDAKKLKNEIFRLKGLFNVTMGKKCRYVGDEIVRDMPKVQWVSQPNVNVRIVRKDGILEGMGEYEMNNLKVNDIIQMERIGFGRIDQKSKEGIVVYFAHR